MVDQSGPPLGSEGTEPPAERPASAVVTPTLIVLNAAVYAAMAFETSEPLSPSVATLNQWGANVGRLTLDGEWWRLVTCMFLHGGLLHLALNVYVLWVVGRALERLLGSANVLVLYFTSGILASLTSLAWSPFITSVGSSGAIFGLWGALLAVAIRQRASTDVGDSSQLRNSALIFLVANVAFGLTQENVDMAAHFGGLAAGFGGGLIIALPTHPQNRTKREARLALLCAIALAISWAVAAAIPRRPVEIHAELERFDEIQRDLTERFTRAFTGEDGSLEVDAMRALLEEELLPPWNEARLVLESLDDLPDKLRSQVDELIQRAREQEAIWTRLAGDMGRFQDALAELQELEDRTMESYERAAADRKAGRISVSEFSDSFDREVLAEWQTDRQLDHLEHLRSPLDQLAEALRVYADTRELAWSLYSEAVHSGDEELALAAAEQHERAEGMIKGWTGVQDSPEAQGQ